MAAASGTSSRSAGSHQSEKPAGCRMLYHRRPRSSARATPWKAMREWIGEGCERGAVLPVAAATLLGQLFMSPRRVEPDQCAEPGRPALGSGNRGAEIAEGPHPWRVASAAHGRASTAISRPRSSCASGHPGRRRDSRTRLPAARHVGRCPLRWSRRRGALGSARSSEPGRCAEAAPPLQGPARPRRASGRPRAESAPRLEQISAAHLVEGGGRSADVVRERRSARPAARATHQPSADHDDRDAGAAPPRPLSCRRAPGARSLVSRNQASAMV